MKYEIYDLQTDTVTFTNDDELAVKLSYDHDRYDITILEESCESTNHYPD